MVKLLIGGSPCQHWSIAQTANREFTACGIGWELFRNYLIAKEKFRPDYFLYENVASAPKAIKKQIAIELNQPVQYINANLVSAQNRNRLYVHNFGDVPQPVDRGVTIHDILESDGYLVEKSYKLDGGSLKARPVHHGYSKYKRVYNSNPAKQQHDYIAESIRIGTIENEAKHDSKQYRIYSLDGKSVTLCGEGGGMGAKTGLYMLPAESDAPKPVYYVENNTVNVDGTEYPIMLSDGYYTIRKLTPLECERLQTLPDGYTSAVSSTQRYRGIGNGWCAEVIIHMLSFALWDVPKDEHIKVLSLYDGIGTGRYCLDKMGFTNVEYYAYEIDKYAMQVSNSNYPDIIQHGDAFQVRDDAWTI